MRIEARRGTLSWRATDTCNWNLPIKGGHWNIYYAKRLTFFGPWSVNLSVSHLDSVDRRERMSFCQWVVEVRTHFVWEFWNIQCSPHCSGLLSKKPKKITQVVMPFPNGFRLSSCYRPAFAIFGPPTWSLNVVAAMNCRGRRLQCWSIDGPECRMPSNLGYVERSWRWVVKWFWRRGLEFLVKEWVSGAPILFSLRNLGNLFIWTRKI